MVAAASVALGEQAAQERQIVIQVRPLLMAAVVVAAVVMPLAEVMELVALAVLVAAALELWPEQEQQEPQTGAAEAEAERPAVPEVQESSL